MRFPLLLSLIVYFLFTGATLKAQKSIPKAFDSLNDAYDYANKSFAGGTIQLFNLKGAQYLVLSIYGSGVPDIAIVAYKKNRDKWIFEAQGKRSPNPSVKHTVVQDLHSLIIKGNDGFKSVLIK